MEIIVIRKYFKDDYTIGKLYLNGKYFCDTLEPKDRGLNQYMSKEEIAKIKVKGKTAIPFGTYEVILTQSAKFGRLLPEILNVKGFLGVRFHSLNYPHETEACIGVGENKKKGMIINSRIWETYLIAELKKAKAQNDSVKLIVIK